MSDALAGLRLSKAERIVVVGLSYVFCAPLLWTNGKRLLRYFSGVASEARDQLRDEDQAARRRVR
ncbi:hypothetical protein Tdes44962_MAKER04234 [Teratosphaeria destructans]|uniref:Uncharacterized protein n=1 Tax=Teratosphaeria destructans TaxID=418781 RepID=A0A9W7SMT4_9PEZI|nr:hypothetical protein Tdes44962_MAKER04234 [Teratosphaeria destructans]